MTNGVASLPCGDERNNADDNPAMLYGDGAGNVSANSVGADDVLIARNVTCYLSVAIKLITWLVCRVANDNVCVNNDMSILIDAVLIITNGIDQCR